MTMPTLLLPLDGTLTGQDRNGPMTATGSGALRWVDSDVPGKQAAFVEEGTANYVTNPVAGVNTDGWNTSSNRTLEPSSLPTPLPGMISTIDTAFCATATADISSAATMGNTSIAVPAGPLTVSVWVYIPSSWTGGEIILSVSSFTGQTGQPTKPANMAIRDAWQRVETSITVMSDDITGLVNIIKNSGMWFSGEHIWFTAVMAEAKPYATSFCPQFDDDGNLLPGYAWAGPAHASASTRAASSIAVPLAVFPAEMVIYHTNTGGAWQASFLTAPGAFGAYGVVAHSAGVITISPSSHGIHIGPLVAFDRPLTDTERAKVAAAMEAGTLEWGTLANRVSGLPYIIRPTTPKPMLVGVPRAAGSVL